MKCIGCGKDSTEKFCSVDCYTARAKERFLALQRRVEGDGCFVWQGARDRDGYGVFKHRGGTLAHRFAWALANGRIPHGLLILHKCDNPPCTRADHLFVGTYKANAVDRQQKHRGHDAVRARRKQKLARHLRANQVG